MASAWHQACHLKCHSSPDSLLSLQLEYQTSEANRQISSVKAELALRKIQMEQFQRLAAIASPGAAINLPIKGALQPQLGRAARHSSVLEDSQRKASPSNAWL